MKTDYNALDASILLLVETLPRRLDAVLADSGVRIASARVSRRRSGASPADSTDETIMERLQALRRGGQIS
jgi:hypothetical protein